MHLLTGSVLQNGKYVIESILGQGGLGITYRATHTYLEQPIVIKTLNESYRHHREFQEYSQQLIHQTRQAAQCQHPNLVKILDFFEQDQLPFIVFEYIPGETLADIIQAGEILAEATAINYIHQIGSALSVIHQQGLLHQDIKPHNIVRRSGTEFVVLIDFGMTRELKLGLIPNYRGVISEGYAPIEQYLSQTKRTPALDIYGLAATLYCLLTGKPPIAAILRDRFTLQSPRQFHPEISSPVEKAILRGLELEAHKRPQTVAEWLITLPDQDQPFNPYDFHPPQTTLPPSKLFSTKTNQKNEYGEEFPQPWIPLIFLITGAISAVIGASFGLIFRQNSWQPSGWSHQPSQQSFPESKKWPITPSLLQNSGEKTNQVTPLEPEAPNLEHQPEPEPQPEYIPPDPSTDISVPIETPTNHRKQEGAIPPAAKPSQSVDANR